MIELMTMVARNERPLITRDSVDSQSERCNRIYEKVKREWNYLPLSRLWSIGYSRSLLVGWFASFPPELVHAFKSILVILQRNMIARVSYLKTFESMRTTVDCDSRSSDLGRAKDDVPACAYSSVRFDPENQSWKKAWTNNDQDVTFEMSGIEFLCLVIDELLNSTVDEADRYHRQIFVCNGAVRAVLLHRTRTHSYNSVGQLVQVID